jgi:drug/metabolite transporter (DMT)-like permease
LGNVSGVLTATLLALGAAVLHATWNLAVKQSGARYLALWGQFAIAGVIGLALIVVAGGLPATGWMWAGLSGLLHLPYCWFLARGYHQGDFSLVYPIARGGGALLATLGGVVLLGDHLSPVSIGAIVLVGAGLFLLAGRAGGAPLRSAIVVAATIGSYTLVDAKGIRSTGTAVYAVAPFVATALTTTVFGAVTGQRTAMIAAMRASLLRFTVLGLASMLTYGMVQIAFEHAPVGYVTALRESSVVIAAIAGTRLLGEANARRRVVASGVVLSGLVVLVAAR